jgi:hypothetical protein
MAETGKYKIVIHAVIESALIMWIALLIYGLSTIAAQTNHEGTMVCATTLRYGLISHICTSRLRPYSLSSVT